MLVEVLCELVSLAAPAGNETTVREYIVETISRANLETRIDAGGNIIAIRKGKATHGKKIALMAHMDEVGVIVNRVLSNGLLVCCSLSGLKADSINGQRITFLNGVHGVVVLPPATSPNSFCNIVLVDIGAKDENEARKMINIGEWAVFSSNIVIQGNIIISKALDNRVGCAMLIELLYNQIEIDHDCYFVFTTSEEVGNVGAAHIARSYEFDMVICIDTTKVISDLDSYSLGIRIGHGPGVKLCDGGCVTTYDQAFGIMDCAEKEDIPVQIEALSRGQTDLAVFWRNGKVVDLLGISIPCKYMHSGNEIVDLNDINYAIKLIQQYLVQVYTGGN